MKLFASKKPQTTYNHGEGQSNSKSSHVPRGQTLEQVRCYRHLVIKASDVKKKAIAIRVGKTKTANSAYLT